MAKLKRTPVRTCVVCGTSADKRSLTRLVRTPDEGVEIDLTGKRTGRGAYLCSNPDCWAEAAQGSVVERALRTELTNPEREAIRKHRASMVRSPIDGG